MHTKKGLSPTGTLLRIGKLDTLTGVRQELVRIYRAARKGELDTQDLTRFAFVLQAIARVITQSDLDARVAAMEQRLATPEANNHDAGSPTLPH